SGPVRAARKGGRQRDFGPPDGRAAGRGDRKDAGERVRGAFAAVLVLPRALETAGDQIGLSGLGAARGRLGVEGRGKIALEHGEQLVLGAALEDLGDESAAWRKDIEC